MRATIFGSSGLLGQALLREWKGDDLTGLNSRDADLRDANGIRELILDSRPDWIVLLAAYTDVDGCEGNPERAFAVNRDGAVHVAQAAATTKSRVLFISSDYVFDGEKGTPYEIDDPRNPINVYGRSKAEAEVKLLEFSQDCCIVRTSWLFGVGGKCFPDTILQLAKTRPELRVVEDQRGCPTYTVDLARAIAGLVSQQACGIVHATNAGNCSWFEFASAILESKKQSVTMTPVSSVEFPRPARRPANSVLSPSSLHTRGIELPSWHEALTAYLRQRQN